MENPTPDNSTCVYIVVSHGSRRQNSNNNVLRLIDSVNSQIAHNNARHVTAAFLEFTSPSIAEKIDEVFNGGATKVVLLPYFLSPGHHVTRDIPAEVEAAQLRWPSKIITVLPHLGASATMADLIIKSLITPP